jgi:hypothetical protein
MSKKIWTEETITKKALEFKSRKEFQLKAGGAYKVARELKIIDKISYFRKQASGAYSAAINFGILEEIAKKMEQPISRMSNDEFLLLAKETAINFTNIYAFSRKHRAIHKRAKKEMILNKLFEHITDKK